MRKPLYRNPVRNLYALGLADDDADVNAYPKNSEPALVWAADYGTPVVVKALLARGAKVDARVKNGRTALEFAAESGREATVRLLLAAGAKVGAYEPGGFTALMGVYNVRIARRLLQRGADVNARAEDGWTPLLCAVLDERPELVAFLLAHGANLHARNAEGETALLFHMDHLNSFNHAEHIEITRILLQAGAQVNDTDNAGESPLSKAVSRLHYTANAADAIRLLLDAGAVAGDAVGAELLAWTKRNGHDEAARLLAAAGAQE